MALCVQLTERERASGNVHREQCYRLPTSAEWEFACRAGTVSDFSFGEDGPSEDYAWYGGGGTDEQLDPGGTTTTEMYAHPVRMKSPNSWRLYDMHGNVWEWVSDYSKVSGDHHLTRGGSWDQVLAFSLSGFVN